MFKNKPIKKPPAPCGVTFEVEKTMGREQRCRRHTGVKGAMRSLCIQTVQHKDFRLPGKEWSRRGEKGGKVLYGHDMQTQMT